MPLFPCFLDGNTTSTIPHKYAPRQKQAFEYGCADGSACRPGISQGQSRLRDQHLAVELWLAPASNQGAFGRKNRRGTQPVQDWISALQKPGRPGSVLMTRYDKYIPGIYLSYVPTQWIVLFEGSWRVSRLGIYMYMLVLSCGDSLYFISMHLLSQNQNKNKRGIYQVYTK